MSHALATDGIHTTPYNIGIDRFRIVSIMSLIDQLLIKFLRVIEQELSVIPVHQYYQAFS